MKILKLSLLSAMLFFVFAANATDKTKIPKEVKISKTELMDKIKGGWAGQVIGVCYGLPTEFKYRKQMIPPWLNHELTGEYLKKHFNNDDIYMDAKFLEVIGRLGLEAPADSFAMAFAHAGFGLQGANLAARYNILNGIMPPESGHWKNTMHSDDIDFQIEADFAGLTSAGVLDAAVNTSDKVGHIMNYGDGWYSGVYVAAMYSLAFIYDDVNTIVNEALRLIPQESKFHKAMSDVIHLHKVYPDDWTKTWQAIEDCEWSTVLHNPGGIFEPFNMDANLNMAYVLVGLLYGEGDFFKSMDISMRCGQDSDCNPATAGGILGAMMGYDKIPAKWLNSYKEIEDVTLNYTSVSLNDCYDICYRSSIENIVKYGGREEGDKIIIKYHEPETLPLELAYPGIYPKEVRMIEETVMELDVIEFTGTGIVIRPSHNGVWDGNYMRKMKGKGYEDYVAEIEVHIDGKIAAVQKLPFAWHGRAKELYYNLELPKGNHTLELNWINPVDELDMPLGKCIVFTDEPIKFFKL